jgi:hypothetical protein
MLLLMLLLLKRSVSSVTIVVCNFESSTSELDDAVADFTGTDSVIVLTLVATVTTSDVFTASDVAVVDDVGSAKVVGGIACGDGAVVACRVGGGGGVGKVDGDGCSTFCNDGDSDAIGAQPGLVPHASEVSRKRTINRKIIFCCMLESNEQAENI